MKAPRPVIVTRKDNGVFSRVLYSYYSTIAGWGVHLMYGTG